MIKKIILVIVIFVCLTNVAVSYYVYQSYVQQKTILFDINTGNYTLDYSGLNEHFPNITVTGMNMSSVKARYLVNDKKYEESLSLLDEIEYDPLNMDDLYKAQVYYSLGKLDSFNHYALEAYKNSPMLGPHLLWYYKSLSNQKNFKKLFESYDKINNEKSHPQSLYFFFATMLNYRDIYEKELIIRAEEVLKNKSIKKDRRLNTILQMIIVGRENYESAIKSYQLGDDFFNMKDYRNAANYYFKSYNLNKLNEFSFENYIICRYKEGKFKEVIDQVNKGKIKLSEKLIFILIKSYLEENECSSACQLLNKNLSEYNSLRKFISECKECKNK